MLFINYLYRATQIDLFRKIRGVWRIRKFIQKNFFIQDKHFKVPYLDHSIYVCPTHSMGRKVFEGGVYEPAVIKRIQTFVKNGYSFIDIGANIGLHTLAAAFVRVNNDQVFISFEPDSAIFEVLQKNCLVNELHFVKCVHEGIGDTNAFLPLYVSQTTNKGRNSFLPRENTRLSEPIKVSTLDNLFLDNDNLTSKCVLIKIDTEGYELPIIYGGIKWLSKIENLVVICEVSPIIMKPNNMEVDDLFEAVRKCGLAKYSIVQDEETIKDLGSTSDQFIAIFYKGMLSEKILLTQ